MSKEILLVHTNSESDKCYYKEYFGVSEPKTYKIITKSHMLEIIDNYLKHTSDLKMKLDGLFKNTNMQEVCFINNHGDTLKLVSQSLKKSFPINKINEKNKSLYTAKQVKDLIDNEKIDNIIIAQSNKNMIKLNKYAYSRIEKNYDLNNLLIILVEVKNGIVNAKAIPYILKTVGYFIDKKQEHLINDLSTISNFDNLERYILTFDSSLVLIKGNELNNELFEIKKQSKEILSKKIRRK